MQQYVSYNQETKGNRGLRNMKSHIILLILSISLPSQSFSLTKKLVMLMKEIGVKNPFIIGHLNINEAHEFFKIVNQNNHFVRFLTEIQNISYTGCSGILLNLPYRDLNSSITQSWIILKYI